MNKKSEIKYCCGCGLCSHYVKGGISDRGYYRPYPDMFPGNFDTNYCYCNLLDEASKNGMWGTIQAAYYGWSRDEEVRNAASSGGVLTSAACFLLETKKVDQVIQVKFSDVNPMETAVVWNSRITQVKDCSGSRYSASASLVGLLDNLDMQKKYAVIGKPCDMRVLRHYMESHPELKKCILYLLSFFCGGTPSKQANDRLLKKMKLSRDDIKYFSYRGNGWPGMTTGIEKNGRTASMEYEESWGTVLGRDLQEICRFCWESVGEAADISCGDGWYLENNKPSFKERDGRNIIFARTDQGKMLLDEMNKAGRITLESVPDLNVMKEMQPGQYMRKGAMFARVLAMKMMFKSVPKYSMINMLQYARALPVSLNIRMFGGTVKRILKGKIV